MTSSKGSSRPRDQTCISYISCIGRQVLYLSRHCVVVQSPICVQLFVTPWTAALPISHHLLEFVQVHVHSISAAIQPFHPLRPSSPSALDLSQHNESSVRMRWPKYWSFSFSMGPSSEYSGLISLKIEWLDLLAVQGTFRSLLQHHSLKASILCHSAFFTVQLSQPCDHYDGKMIALAIQIYVIL